MSHQTEIDQALTEAGRKLLTLYGLVVRRVGRLSENGKSEPRHVLASGAEYPQYLLSSVDRLDHAATFGVRLGEVEGGGENQDLLPDPPRTPEIQEARLSLVEENRA